MEYPTAIFIHDRVIALIKENECNPDFAKIDYYILRANYKWQTFKKHTDFNTRKMQQIVKQQVEQFLYKNCKKIGSQYRYNISKVEKEYTLITNKSKYRYYFQYISNTFYSNQEASTALHFLAQFHPKYHFIIRSADGINFYILARHLDPNEIPANDINCNNNNNNNNTPNFKTHCLWDNKALNYKNKEQQDSGFCNGTCAQLYKDQNTIGAGNHYIKERNKYSAMKKSKLLPAEPSLYSGGIVQAATKVRTPGVDGLVRMQKQYEGN